MSFIGVKSFFLEGKAEGLLEEPSECSFVWLNVGVHHCAPSGVPMSLTSQRGMDHCVWCGSQELCALKLLQKSLWQHPPVFQRAKQTPWEWTPKKSNTKGSSKYSTPIWPMMFNCWLWQQVGPVEKPPTHPQCPSQISCILHPELLTVGPEGGLFVLPCC